MAEWTPLGWAGVKESRVKRCAVFGIQETRGVTKESKEVTGERGVIRADVLTDQGWWGWQWPFEYRNGPVA